MASCDVVSSDLFTYISQFPLALAANMTGAPVGCLKVRRLCQVNRPGCGVASELVESEPKDCPVIFQENSSQSSQPQQVSGVIGENCFQVPLEVYHGRQILGKTGAQLLGTGISLYSPWKTIVKFVEGRRKSRRRSIVTAASTGDENDTSSANTITGYGIGSRSRNWTNIILGVNLL